MAAAAADVGNAAVESGAGAAVPPATAWPSMRPRALSKSACPSAPVCVGVMSGHGAPVTSVAVHPGSGVVATASRDANILLWELPSCELAGKLPGSNGAVMMIDWHHKANILAAACYNKAVVLWDTEHMRPIQTIVGFDHPCISVAFQPGGRLLAIGSLRKPVQLWHVPTRRVGGPRGRLKKARSPLLLDGHEDYVTDCAWDETGRVLVTASRDRTAIVWDVATRSQVATLVGHGDSVTTVSVHPSGELIATGSADDTVILWDARTFEACVRFQGGSSGVRRVTFTPDCALLVAAGRDSTAKIFDLASRRMLTEMGGDNVVNTLAVHPCGTRMVTGSRDSDVLVWGGITPSRWSPALHAHFGKEARALVTHVLLVANRIARRGGSGVRDLPPMPTEMWIAVLSMLSRSDMLTPRTEKPPGVKSPRSLRRSVPRVIRAALAGGSCRRPPKTKM